MKTILIAIQAFVCAGILLADNVNLALSKTDCTYAAKVNHHRCIKYYFSMKGDPRVDKLLSLLLTNGATMDDFPKGVFLISTPFSPPIEPIVAELKRQNVPEEKATVILTRRRERMRESEASIIMAHSGITDKRFVDAILDLRQSLIT